MVSAAWLEKQTTLHQHHDSKKENCRPHPFPKCRRAELWVGTAHWKLKLKMGKEEGNTSSSASQLQSSVNSLSSSEVSSPNSKLNWYSLINVPRAAAGKIAEGLRDTEVIPAGLERLRALRTNGRLTSLLFYKCQQQSSGKITPSQPPATLWQTCNSKLKLDGWC